MYFHKLSLYNLWFSEMIMLNVTLTCPGTRAFDIRVCATRLHAYCEASMLQQIQAAALTRLTLDDFWEKIYRYNTQQQQKISVIYAISLVFVSMCTLKLVLKRILLWETRHAHRILATLLHIDEADDDRLCFNTVTTYGPAFSFSDLFSEYDIFKAKLIAHVW